MHQTELESLASKLRVISTTSGPNIHEQIGWNNAIISIIREKLNADSGQSEIMHRISQLVNPNHLPTVRIHNELIAHYQTGSKLSAVKYIKDITGGMGLREAKEFVDDLFDRFKETGLARMNGVD